MELPVQITYRHMQPSAAMTGRIEEEAAKLDEFFPRITSCRVMVEAPHRHHRRGEPYHVRIELGVPGTELVVSHEPSAHTALSGGDQIAITQHIRDAFASARRQLQDHVKLLRGEVKHHESSDLTVGA